MNAYYEQEQYCYVQPIIVQLWTNRKGSQLAQTVFVRTQFAEQVMDMYNLIIIQLWNYVQELYGSKKTISCSNRACTY